VTQSVNIVYGLCAVIRVICQNNAVFSTDFLRNRPFIMTKMHASFGVVFLSENVVGFYSRRHGMCDVIFVFLLTLYIYSILYKQNFTMYNCQEFGQFAINVIVFQD